jgi:DNA-binding NtrC family response regulator
VRSLADLERQAIELALQRARGNRSLVAQQLGIGRTTLYRKLKEYGLK